MNKRQYKKQVKKQSDKWLKDNGFESLVGLFKVITKG